VRDATADYATYSNEYGHLLRAGENSDPQVQDVLAGGWPLVDAFQSDPPRHSVYRKLVNSAFTLPSVKALQSRIDDRVNELVSGLASRRSCDFVEQFSIPLPVAVIADVLSMNDLPIGTVKRWSDAFMGLLLGGIVSRERRLQCARDIVECQHHVMSMIRDRRNGADGGDLISSIVRSADLENGAIDDTELLGIIQALMVAGNETTTSTLTEGMLLLIRRPDLQQVLRNQPEKMSVFVEELLRFASAAAGLPRVTKREVTVNGFVIPQNSLVHLRWAAANRDPSQYSDPDSFDLNRTNARTHLGFGRGVHTCVGNMLARAELTAAYSAILTQLDGFEVTDEDALRITPNIFARGLSRLPISYRGR
jgi:cytochrome P450